MILEDLSSIIIRHRIESSFLWGTISPLIIIQRKLRKNCETENYYLVNSKMLSPKEVRKFCDRSRYSNFLSLIMHGGRDLIPVLARVSLRNFGASSRSFKEGSSKFSWFLHSFSSSKSVQVDKMIFGIFSTPHSDRSNFLKLVSVATACKNEGLCNGEEMGKFDEFRRPQFDFPWFWENEKKKTFLFLHKATHNLLVPAPLIW